MKKFVIERELPGAGKLSKEELRAIAKTSCDVINNLGRHYHWLASFVTENKIYCIHIAEDKDIICEHAEKGGFPVTCVAEVATIIDPTTSAC